MTRRSPSNIVELDALCNIAGTAQLAETLKTALAQSGPITLAAASVARIDTAALQLLCALVKEAQQRGREVIWQSPSAAMLESARALDLSRHLGLEDAET